MARKMNWKITIEELDRGRIITVGCKRIAFDGTIEDMLEILQELYDDPQGMYKAWFPEDFEKKMEQEPPRECCGQDANLVVTE